MHFATDSLPAMAQSKTLSRIVAIFAMVVALIGHAPGPVLAAEGRAFGSMPDWPSLVQAHQDRLAKVESDQSAMELFITKIGPGIGLQDVAATLAAKGLSPKLAAELLVPEITKSAQRLVAGLTAWQLADRISRSLASNAPDPVGVSAAQTEWLAAAGPFDSLTGTIAGPEPYDGGSRQTAVALAAGRLAQEAAQQSVAEWWKLRTWKDRVRTARGQHRLCGSWQWAVHNHQNHHQEQRLVLVFPPPGKDGTGLPGLAEIVVLGDLVYLRWEMDGQTQEDSLMFSKEGQRLEGTFVNSQGGWGSISGKRTATCTLQ